MGFTLLELVVALAIAGLAVSAGYSVVALLTDRGGELATASRESSRVAGVRSEIVDWLGEAIVDDARLTPSFSGLDRLRGSVPDDELTFITTARTPLDVSRTQVRLFIARDSAGSVIGLTATLRDWDGSSTIRIPLDSTVGTMDLRFRTSNFEEHGGLDSWISPSALPQSVRIVFGGDGERELPRLLRLPILVPLRNGR